MHPLPRVASGPARFLLVGLAALTAAGSAMANPMGRLARAFNSKLVQMEDRVAWLENRLATLATQKEHSTTGGLGGRWGRLSAADPAPAVTLDLGRERLLESIFLVPAASEALPRGRLFPRRFTIETSPDAGFAEAATVFSTGFSAFPAREGAPVRIDLPGRPARYLRLTVDPSDEGGTTAVYALSELVVISQDEPVSFGAPVQVEGAMDLPGTWEAAFLTDGRMPFGIWQAGPEAIERGSLVQTMAGREAVSWTVRLQAREALDRLHLFPYQLAELGGMDVFPECLEIHLLLTDGTEELAHTWENPMPGTEQLSPLMIPLKGREAIGVRITGTRPWLIGHRLLYGLAELEVWSSGINLALGQPATTRQAGEETVTAALTDGFASDRQILPVAAWLNQLHERARWERELANLQPLREKMATASELNATWGSAVMLGLTFLIPVVIVERRRLISRFQLDQLRKRIASDLHDDIGSNLGSISLIARTARKDLLRQQGPGGVADDLSEMEAIARESSLAMRDIVWLLERRQDSIGDLAHRMRETAGRLLRELTFDIQCESTKTTARLSLDAKRHLFLFYKEAIHNVVRHSQATTVSARLCDEEDRLVMEIRDDGIGLSSDPYKRPPSFQKLHERARDLEGTLDIMSGPGKGTLIKLAVKRSRLIVPPLLTS